MLTPETGSLNPFPKRFQVVLFNPTGGARIDDIYGIANITIVSDSNSQAVWGLADQLYQTIDDTILNRVLQLLNVKVVLESTEEQLAAVMYIIDKVCIWMLLLYWLMTGLELDGDAVTVWGIWKIKMLNCRWYSATNTTVIVLKTNWTFRKENLLSR